MDLRTWHFIISVAGLVVIPLVLAIWQHTSRLRTNDIAHLDQKIDLMHVDIRDVVGKLDRHLAWHAELPRRKRT